MSIELFAETEVGAVICKYHLVPTLDIGTRTLLSLACKIGRAVLFDGVLSAKEWVFSKMMLVVADAAPPQQLSVLKDLLFQIRSTYVAYLYDNWVHPWLYGDPTIRDLNHPMTMFSPNVTRLDRLLLRANLFVSRGFWSSDQGPLSRMARTVWELRPSQITTQYCISVVSRLRSRFDQSDDPTFCVNEWHHQSVEAGSAIESIVAQLLENACEKLANEEEEKAGCRSGPFTFIGAYTEAVGRTQASMGLMDWWVQYGTAWSMIECNRLCWDSYHQLVEQVAMSYICGTPPVGLESMAVQHIKDMALYNMQEYGIYQLDPTVSLGTQLYQCFSDQKYPFDEDQLDWSPIERLNSKFEDLFRNL